MTDQPTVTERINRALTIPSGMVHDQPSPTATQVLLRRSLAYLGAASWIDLYAQQRGAAEVAAADQPTSPDQPERN